MPHLQFMNIRMRGFTLSPLHNIYHVMVDTNKNPFGHNETPIQAIERSILSAINDVIIIQAEQSRSISEMSMVAQDHKNQALIFFNDIGVSSFSRDQTYNILCKPFELLLQAGLEEKYINLVLQSLLSGEAYTTGISMLPKYFGNDRLSRMLPCLIDFAVANKLFTQLTNMFLSLKKWNTSENKLSNFLERFEVNNFDGVPLEVLIEIKQYFQACKPSTHLNKVLQERFDKLEDKIELAINKFTSPYYTIYKILLEMNALPSKYQTILINGMAENLFNSNTNGNLADLLTIISAIPESEPFATLIENEIEKFQIDYEKFEKENNQPATKLTEEENLFYKSFYNRLDVAFNERHHLFSSENLFDRRKTAVLHSDFSAHTKLKILSSHVQNLQEMKKVSSMIQNNSFFHSRNGYRAQKAEEMRNNCLNAAMSRANKN